MAIITNAGPLDAMSLISDALSHYSAIAAQRNTPSLLGGALPSLSEPVRVYVLDIKDIVPGFDLNSAAKAHGWRYIVESGGQHTVMADLSGPRDGTATFRRLNVGPIAQQLYSVCEKATQLFDKTDPENYDVRLLEIPALYRQTLWLHGPIHDHFLTYWPAPVDGVFHEDKRFLEDIVQLAAKTVALRSPAPPEPETTPGLR